ncbi:MAG: TonB-dependent receptor plug domain-containing protein, partial [Bacteroidota bacterium]
MARQLGVVLCGWILFWGACIPILRGQSPAPQHIVVLEASEGTPLAEATLNWIDAAAQPQHSQVSDSLGKLLLPENWEHIAEFTLFKAGYEPLLVNPEFLIFKRFTVKLKPETYQLDEVVFTANKIREKRIDIPHNISVVTRPQIELGNPQTSAALLEQQAGVFVQRSQAGGGSPNLRGFEANKVLLVIDGVRMNNAIYRSGHLQNVITIDPAILDRAEVLFGPGSVIYGSDALGGVMHLFTRKPQLRTENQPRMQGQAALRGSSANGELSAHVDLNVGGTKWASLSSITATRFGNLRSGAWRPDYPAFGRRDSLVQRIDGQDTIVANSNPNLQSPSGYQQLDLLQKFLFVPKSGLSHTLNLQFSNSTDVPRYDRLVQEQDDRLRFAEWYYGPQTRALASYQMVYENAPRWYDNATVTAAYQHIRESRHNRQRNQDWRSDRQEAVDVLSLNIDAKLERVPGHEWTYGTEFTHNWVASHAQQVHILSKETRSLDTRYPDGGTRMLTAASYITYKWTPN